MQKAFFRPVWNALFYAPIRLTVLLLLTALFGAGAARFLRLKREGSDKTARRSPS